MTDQDRNDRRDNLRYWWEMTWPTLMTYGLVIAVSGAVGWWIGTRS